MINSIVKSDLIHACATIGLREPQYLINVGSTVEFQATGYAPHNYGQTNWYRATFRLEGGIQIKQGTKF
jgi:hypothetical protein